MTLCNKKDQTCFSDTLTGARLLGAGKTLGFSGPGYNITFVAQQMLMQRKSCLIAVIKYAQVLG